MRRETRGAFNFGKVLLEGIGEEKGKQAYIEYQNENLICVVDGVIRATVPDLITIVDSETFLPVTTDGLKYGKRVLVCGIACHEIWRTKRDWSWSDRSISDVIQSISQWKYGRERRMHNV